MASQKILGILIKKGHLPLWIFNYVSWQDDIYNRKYCESCVTPQESMAAYIGFGQELSAVDGHALGACWVTWPAHHESCFPIHRASKPFPASDFKLFGLRFPSADVSCQSPQENV